MKNEMLIRKNTRLRHFDYSASRYYFVTICTREHHCYFEKVFSTADSGVMKLNDRGELVDRHIRELDVRYLFARVDKYVIMPNHIHMILLLDNNNDVPLTQIIGLFKSGVSGEMGFPVWQRSFHDHVIRSDKDYKEIWYYIDNNPAKWALDRYYTSDVSIVGE